MIPAVYTKYNLDQNAEIKTLQHSDFFKLDAGGHKMKKSSAGFLMGMAPVAKVGVMSYLMADGTVLREFVPPETLFNKDSMDSLKMKPMTDRHPPERRVTVDNAGSRQIGFTGETVKEDAGKLVISMTITDGAAIGHIEGGRRELSPGYTTDLVFKAGEYDNQKYDAVQVRRQYNHVAVVDEARGGNDVCMNMDGKETAIFEEKDTTKNDNFNKERTMKFLIDGIEYDAAPEVVKYIEKLDARNKEQVAAVATAAAERATLAGEKDALKVKCDGLEKRDIAKEVNDAVEARLALIARVTPVLDAVDMKLDNRALKVAVLAKKCPDIKIDEKTAMEYIDAAFDITLSTVKEDAKDNLSRQQKEMNNNDGKGKERVIVDEKEARAKMIERQVNAYKLETK